MLKTPAQASGAQTLVSIDPQHFPGHRGEFCRRWDFLCGPQAAMLQQHLEHAKFAHIY